MYIFYDQNEKYLFEVRYGGKTANALQRGLWTFTNKNTSIVKVLEQGAYEINYDFLEALKKLSLMSKKDVANFLGDFV